MTLGYLECCGGFTESSHDYDNWGIFYETFFYLTALKNGNSVLKNVPLVALKPLSDQNMTETGWNLCLLFVKVCCAAFSTTAPLSREDFVK